MLNHGGQLSVARRQYPQVKRWLDLSTGISPWSWPVPDIPVAVWNRLPEGLDSLREVAARYYGCNVSHIYPLPGSQAAIAYLPEILDRSTIAIPRWGYGEHALHWRKSGHEVVYYDSTEEVNTFIALKQVDHVLAINPNNPTAEVIDVDELLQWQIRLAVSGGYLIVDQAFADLYESNPMVSLYGKDNVIALRSVGKFFGMAGLRLGFVIAPPSVLQMFEDRLPLWSVSSVGIFLGERMLSDESWQIAQRARVKEYRERLVKQLSEKFGPARLCVGPLFISLFGAEGELKACHDSLAEQGVWVRYFEPVQNRSCLRFGLVDERGFDHLQRAIDCLEIHPAVQKS